MCGSPVPQGSMRGFVVNGRAVLTSSSKNLKEWRNLIAAQANHVMADSGKVFFTSKEPVEVTAKFSFVRPKSHLKSSGELTKSAPRYKYSKPDSDKLARSVLDALTGVLYEDDSQVVRLLVTKGYADPGIGPGVEISVERYEGTRE